MNKNQVDNRILSKSNGVWRILSPVVKYLIIFVSNWTLKDEGEIHRSTNREKLSLVDL